MCKLEKQRVAFFFFSPCASVSLLDPTAHHFHSCRGEGGGLVIPVFGQLRPLLLHALALLPVHQFPVLGRRRGRAGGGHGRSRRHHARGGRSRRRRPLATPKPGHGKQGPWRGAGRQARGWAGGPGPWGQLWLERNVPTSPPREWATSIRHTRMKNKQRVHAKQYVVDVPLPVLLCRSREGKQTRGAGGYLSCLLLSIAHYSPENALFFLNSGGNVNQLYAPPPHSVPTAPTLASWSREAVGFWGEARADRRVPSVCRVEGRPWVATGGCLASCDVHLSSNQRPLRASRGHSPMHTHAPGTTSTTSPPCARPSSAARPCPALLLSPHASIPPPITPHSSPPPSPTHEVTHTHTTGMGVHVSSRHRTWLGVAAARTLLLFLSLASVATAATRGEAWPPTYNTSAGMYVYTRLFPSTQPTPPHRSSPTPPPPMPTQRRHQAQRPHRLPHPRRRRYVCLLAPSPPPPPPPLPHDFSPNPPTHPPLLQAGSKPSTNTTWVQTTPSRYKGRENGWVGGWVVVVGGWVGRLELAHDLSLAPLARTHTSFSSSLPTHPPSSLPNSTPASSTFSTRSPRASWPTPVGSLPMWSR